MKKRITRWFLRLLILSADSIPLNVCKVMTTAFIAGTIFAMLCLEGQYFTRAAVMFVVCLMFSAFFGTLTAIGNDLEDGLYAEDDLCM